MNQHEPPKTIREVGLVLYYMNQHIAELTNTVKEQNGVFATKEELEDLEVRVQNLENATKVKSNATWIDNPKVQAVLGALAITIAAVGAWLASLGAK